MQCLYFRPFVPRSLSCIFPSWICFSLNSFETSLLLTLSQLSLIFSQWTAPPSPWSPFVLSLLFLYSETWFPASCFPMAVAQRTQNFPALVPGRPLLECHQESNQLYLKGPANSKWGINLVSNISTGVNWHSSTEINGNMAICARLTINNQVTHINSSRFLVLLMRWSCVVFVYGICCTSHTGQIKHWLDWWPPWITMT